MEKLETPMFIMLLSSIWGFAFFYAIYSGYYDKQSKDERRALYEEKRWLELYRKHAKNLKKDKQIPGNENGS